MNIEIKKIKLEFFWVVMEIPILPFHAHKHWCRYFFLFVEAPPKNEYDLIILTENLFRENPQFKIIIKNHTIRLSNSNGNLRIFWEYYGNVRLIIACWFSMQIAVGVFLPNVHVGFCICFGDFYDFFLFSETTPKKSQSFTPTSSFCGLYFSNPPQKNNFHLRIRNDVPFLDYFFKKQHFGKKQIFCQKMSAMETITTTTIWKLAKEFLFFRPQGENTNFWFLTFPPFFKFLFLLNTASMHECF